MEQVADINQQGSDHDRLPDQDEQRIHGRVLHDHGPGRKGDVGDHGHGHAANLATAEPPPPEAPYGGDDHPGGAALQERLEDGERREVVDPVARRDVRGQVRQSVRESDQRLGEAEPKAGSDAEDEPVDRLREIGTVGQEERRDWFERFLDHRHEQAEDQHRTDAYAGPAEGAAEVLERVVDHALEEGDDDADDDPAADREAEHEGRLVAVDLGLVQVDQIKDGDEEGRNQDRGGDQPRDVKEKDAREAGDEGPAELVDLGVPQVR